jgi:hypothetical protein
MKEGLPIALAALAGCTNALVITSPTEIAAHRQFEAPIIRGADACVDEISRIQEVGYGAFADFSLHVDRMGHARVVEILGLSQDSLPNAGTTACRHQVEAVTATWRYRPFEQRSRPVMAQITERVLMLPEERWRAPRRPFPEVVLDSVLITLERMPSLYICDRDRSASYVLHIRGDGDVTYTERVRNTVVGGPLLVDGPTRRYRVSPDDVERLVDQFRSADFFSLEEEYASGITDQPGQILIFDTGVERATVRDYVGETVGMPLVVRDLEVAVDATAGLPRLLCGPDMTLNSRRPTK